MIAGPRKLVPGKPLPLRVNSHHHFDHAGGLHGGVRRRDADHQRGGEATVQERPWPADHIHPTHWPGRAAALPVEERQQASAP
ncbi:MAG: MBL fold metallo-hydrolase [Ramlibacter sp.]|nr:MBL fold metallo-hydrolase [Ramlibacter sp.]